MIKRVITIAILLAIVAGATFAGAHPGGFARQLALGGFSYNPTGQGGNLVINPFIWDDPTVMLLNPAYQNMYRDYAWMAVAGGTVSGLNSGNSNGYGHQFAGVNFAFGKELALGANLSFDPSFTNYVATQLANFVGGVSGRAAQPTLPPVDVFEAVASYDLGSVDVGFAFLYGIASNTSKTSVPAPGASTDNEHSARVFGFRFGTVVDLGGGMVFDADAALRLDKATDKLTMSPVPAATPLGEYSATATEIQVDARLKLKMSNKVNFIPYVGFVTISGEPKQDTPPTPTSPALTSSIKYSAMILAVGAGMDYKVNNFYFAGGVSYHYGKFKSEFSVPPPATSTTQTLSSSALPVINLGAEWTLLDWLTARMGYYRTFASLGNKTEATNGTTSTTTETSNWNGNSNVFFSTYNSPDNGLVTLGLGLKFGNFALDGTVSEEALRRGFGLIGAQDNINTFGYVNISYCFD